MEAESKTAAYEKVSFVLDDSLWSDKEVCGLLKVRIDDENLQFMVSVKGLDHTFIDERDHDDPIQRKIMSMSGRYVRMVVAEPMSTYMSNAYNWVRSIVDDRRLSIRSIETLPIHALSYLIHTVDNEDTSKTVIECFHAGVSRTFHLLCDNPDYFKLCDQIMPGACVTIHHVIRNDDRIIVDITEEQWYVTDPMRILGCKKFTLSNACPDAVELVCKCDQPGTRLFSRFFSEKKPVFSPDKRYTLKCTALYACDGWANVENLTVVDDVDVGNNDDTVVGEIKTYEDKLDEAARELYGM